MFPRISASVAVTGLSAFFCSAAAPQEPAATVGPAGKPPPAVAGWARLATDYAGERSVTGGIQEAIDSLPEDGGTVYVPEGIYEIHACIRMKPHAVLMGAGRGSIIRKDPAWIVPLVEDVKKGSEQSYVVVEDASKLRPGMYVIVGDLTESSGEGAIERIEGNRVFLQAGRRGALYPRAWKPEGDSLVSRKAALYNGFPLIRTSQQCVISHLAFDGNKEAQKVDGKGLYWSYPAWAERLRCAPYLGGYSRLEDCWLYDAVGVCVSLGWTATVSHCDISGNWQGVHAEGGAYSKIVGNRIHHHEHIAVSFCLGNYGLTVTDNHIHDSLVGIGEMGDLEDRPGRGGDHFSIISHNVIYRNRDAGIRSGQGKVGPPDFIITDNVVMNNGLAGGRQLGAHRVPAGISLFNAQRCVIANNRVMDEQDRESIRLAGKADAGATRIALQQHPVYGFVHPMAAFYENWTDFFVTLSDGSRAERHLVKRLHHLGARGVEMELADPLVFEYPEGSLVTPEKSQLWGIFVGGPRAEENVIANNVTVGNRIGGILWDGKNTAVSANVGDTVHMDAGKSLEENVYPAAARVAVSAPGFEGKIPWQLGPSASLDAASRRSGKRSLRLAKAGAPGVAEAVSGAVSLEANTRYRLTAWVRTSARRGDQVALPTLTLEGVEGESVVGALQPALRCDFERPAVEAAHWVRVTGEGLTGPRGGQAVIRCRLGEGVTGDAWVDDVALEKLAG
ncbi:MAG: right-handed parallel beta-helix repeat-containing protein [Armatimonadetes bacterium]|nr:right-handed parallel beta-helix repeat-containing protein [Armatimonadota bacterium]